MILYLKENVRMSKVISIDIRLKNIKEDIVIDFDGIQDAKQISLYLKHFDYNIELKNIEYLPNLKNLKLLKIIGGGLSDISFVSRIPSLEEINLSSNSIKDISPLKDLKLKKIWLYNNKITDISCISEFKYLLDIKILSLLSNPITDYSFILLFKNLEKLCIGTEHENNNIELTDEHISVLSKLPNLLRLNNKFGTKYIKQLIYEWKLDKLINSL